MILEGTATKRRHNKWKIILTNDSEFTANEEDLLDENKFTVTAVGRSMTKADLQHDAWKMKRQRKREEAKNESSAKHEAFKRRNEMKCLEYIKITERIRKGEE